MGNSFIRSSCIAVLLVIPLSVTGYLNSVHADEHSLQRAVNLARGKAEFLNGGLNSYRAASCMYSGSESQCLVNFSGRGYLFRFLGGVPGWQQLGIAPSLDTEILIAPDGSSVLQVIYNGPPR